MTHNDIYTKFLIEYDKANVTSSYPSLTKYEAATLLDRAYLALISRKLTGNNTRRVPFEYDTKAIEDLRPLVTTKRFEQKGGSNIVLNEYKFGMPDDLLYYIEGVANYGSEREIVLPVNHQIARKFKLTNSNFPWVNHPVSYIEGSEVYVLIDPFLHKDGPSLDGTYIKKPASFVVSLKKVEDDLNGGNSDGDNSGGENNEGGNHGGDTPVTVTPPIITPDNLTFIDNLLVTITASQVDHIVYRINSGIWHEYTLPISITETSTVEAYAVLNGVASLHVTKTYTKQLEQQSQGSASVSILECYYANGKLHIKSTVSKSNYEGKIYRRVYVYDSKGLQRQLGSTTIVSLFDVSIPLSYDNIRYTDVRASVVIYNERNGVLDYKDTDISNMPEKVPTITIQECRYIEATANQLAQIYIKYYVDLKGSDIAVDVFRWTVQPIEGGAVYQGGLTGDPSVTENKLIEQTIDYISGAKKIKVLIRSIGEYVYCDEDTADITNLPSNAPEIIDIENNDSEYGELVAQWGTIPRIFYGVLTSKDRLFKNRLYRIFVYSVEQQPLFPNPDPLKAIVELRKYDTDELITVGSICRAQLYNDFHEMQDIVEYRFNNIPNLTNGNYVLKLLEGALVDDNYIKRYNGDTSIPKSQCRINKGTSYYNYFEYKDNLEDPVLHYESIAYILDRDGNEIIYGNPDRPNTN